MVSANELFNQNNLVSFKFLGYTVSNGRRLVNDKLENMYEIQSWPILRHICMQRLRNLMKHLVNTVGILIENRIKYFLNTKNVFYLHLHRNIRLGTEENNEKYRSE
jgi:hypothetical protein